MQMESLVGTVLDERYVLQEFLGRGAHAAVFRAVQLQPKSEVAVKVLDPDLIALDPSFVQRFIKEADHCATLRDAHTPHVANVLDFATDQRTGLVYLVMTLLGESLDQIIRRSGPLAPATVQILADHLGMALEAVHRRGWVHGDVKCSNVLINRDGTCFVLSDFGVSTDFDAERTIALENDIHGSPLYLAPEFRSSVAANPDPRSDLYALGVVLYRATTGKYPELSSDLSLAHYRRQLPEALRRLIPRLLNADPKQRPQSASEFLAGLHPQRSLRRRALIGGIAIALLGAVLAGVWLLKPGRSLRVETTPQGARFVLERPAAQGGGPLLVAEGRTPGVVRNLRVGDYDLHVELAGYVPVVARVASDRPTGGMFPVVLERAVPVEIVSEPGGVPFTLVPLDAVSSPWRPDREDDALKTPWRNDQHYAPGRYVVAVSPKDGYASIVDTLTVGVDGARANYRLETVTGALMIECREPATVSIDGAGQRLATPCLVEGLRAGRHRVHVRGPRGYAERDTQIDVQAGCDTLRFVLARQASPVRGGLADDHARPEDVKVPKSTPTPPIAAADTQKVHLRLLRPLIVVVGGQDQGTHEGNVTISLSPTAPRAIEVREPGSLGCSRTLSVPPDIAAPNLGNVDVDCAIVTIAASTRVELSLDGHPLTTSAGELLSCSVSPGPHRLGVAVAAGRAQPRVVYYPEMRELPVTGGDTQFRFYRLEAAEAGETKLHIQVR